MGSYMWGLLSPLLRVVIIATLLIAPLITTYP